MDPLSYKKLLQIKSYKCSEEKVQNTTREPFNSKSSNLFKPV